MSDTVELQARGTPQGAVLSPLLFNLSVLEIPQPLDPIPNLKYSLYADDITLRVKGGSDAQIEQTLQEGIQEVVTGAEKAGLRCSRSKSELLLVTPKTRGKVSPNIKIHIGDYPIPEVSTLKILGRLTQNNRANTEYLKQLERHVAQMIDLISRISNRRKGLREYPANPIIRH